MNRRNFLATLLSGLTLDPEKALWVPGKKLISIPTRGFKYGPLIDQRIAHLVALQMKVVWYAPLPPPPDSPIRRWYRPANLVGTDRATPLPYQSRSTSPRS